MSRPPVLRPTVAPARTRAALVRRVVGRLVVLVVVLVALTGCSFSSVTTPPTPSPVSDLNSVSLVNGDGEGVKPKVTLTTPFVVDSPQRRVLVQGTGPQAKAGQRVTIQYLGINGADGKEFDTSYGGRPTSFVLRPANNIKGLVEALVGTPVGTRLLLALPPADAFGLKGRPTAGIGPTDTIVVVVDLQAAKDVLARATGTPVTPKAGLPTVVVDAVGKPKITLPKTRAPSALVVQPLIIGGGAKIARGQQITVQYSGVIWPGGTVFDSSWQRGAASSFQIGVGAVISGWDDGLVGQSVGSRILLVIPPDEGYGADGKADAGIKGTDTLVFVIDLLDAA